MVVLSENQTEPQNPIDIDLAGEIGTQLVTFDPTRLKPALNKNATLSLDEVFLIPGSNYLTVSDFGKLKQHPDLAYFVSIGAISIEETQEVNVTISQPKTPKK